MGKLRRYDLQHMLSTNPPAIPWIVEPIAAIGEVTVLYGAPGVGKSLFCLGIAEAVSRGDRRVAGLRCRSAKTAYIDAENGEWEVHRRVKSLDIDPERLTIYDATGIHLIDDYEEIEAAVRDEKSKFVVLDSLRRLLPGIEENDSGAMAEALGLCKLLALRARAAVLVIHHPKKNGEDYRGSSAIADQTSILYRLDKEKGDVDRLRRRLENQKMRIAAEPSPRFLRIGVEDGAVTVDVAFEPNKEEVAAGPADADLTPRILDLLEEEQPITRAQIAKALGRAKTDGTIRRVFERLEAAGRIEQDEDTGKWTLAKSGLPNKPQDGKGVPKTVATGKGVARDRGKGVAKSGRARQPQDGNPKKSKPKRGSS